MSFYLLILIYSFLFIDSIDSYLVEKYGKGVLRLRETPNQLLSQELRKYMGEIKARRPQKPQHSRQHATLETKSQGKDFSRH